MSELSGENSGLKTVVAQLHSPELPVPGAEVVEQLDFLPLQQAGKVVAPATGKQLPAPRGAGRPPGAQNKSTEAWRDFILARYTSPLQALAETYSRTPHDLAAELGCDRLEAFKLQIMAAKELAPYLHQKQPLAIQGSGGAMMSLTINTGQYSAHESAENPGSFNVKFHDAECIENQSLIDGENENSVEANSVEGEKDE